ncbi:MAG: hypothetical protein ACW981_03285 [Candidatus Hodarchaeales archaeon]|jgi:hypothetical protein
MVEIISQKGSKDLEETEIIHYQEFKEEALMNLSQYWYCDRDSSKYVEKVEGYSRNNTGQFTIYLDERLEHSLENAVAIRKLPETCINFTKIMIKEMQSYPLPESFPQKARTEVHLMQVECPICKKVSIAPKIPVVSLDTIRESQVNTIKYSIKAIEEKYDTIRKRLDFMFFIGAGMILILVLIFISIWLLFLRG